MCTGAISKSLSTLTALATGISLILIALWAKSLKENSSFSAYFDPDFHDLKREPKIGSKLPLKDDWKGQPIFDHSSKVLVALMGGCQSCSRNHYNIGSEPDRNFGKIVFVFDNPVSELDQKSRELKGRYGVVCDPRQELDHRLNAEWYPRLYVADGDGHLLAAQSPKKTVEQFLREQS